MQTPLNIPQGNLADRRLTGKRLLSPADSRLFVSSSSLRYLRILVLSHIWVVRPNAWFGQEPDVVHFLSKSIPVVMGLFTLWAAATGKITRVNIQASATASRGHRQAGQSIRRGHLKLSNHIKLWLSIRTMNFRPNR